MRGEKPKVRRILVEVVFTWTRARSTAVDDVVHVELRPATGASALCVSIMATSPSASGSPWECGGGNGELRLGEGISALEIDGFCVASTMKGGEAGSGSLRWSLAALASPRAAHLRFGGRAVDSSARTTLAKTGPGRIANVPSRGEST